MSSVRWLARCHRLVLFAMVTLTVAVEANAAERFVVGAVPGMLGPLEQVAIGEMPAGATSSPPLQGISADFAGEVARALAAPLEWRAYPDRAALIAALRRGEIDAATSATGEDAGPALLLSRPYLSTKQVYAEPRTPRVATGRIAFVAAQTSPARLAAAYPKKRPAAYPDTVSALLAVTLGEADAFVGDLVATGYAIDHFDLSALAITGFAPFEEGGYSFAFDPSRPGAAALRDRVDAALAALPPRFLLEVRARWGAGSAAVTFDQPLALTADERAWIAAHPVVRYALLARAAPFTFRDAEGRPAGLAVDMLAAIARVTGLRFEGRARRSAAELDADLAAGRATLVPLGLTPAAVSSGYVLTRPYGEGLFVIVTRAGAPPLADAAALAGRRVALPAGFPVTALVRSRVPDAKIVDTPPFDGQFDAVANGRADATVAEMAFANYAAGNAYRDRIAISGAFTTQPVPHAFAVAASEPVLLGIMNRAIAHMSPAELDAIRRRWSLLAHPEAQWERRRPQVALGAAAALAVLLLLGAWAVSLRVQIVRRIAAEAAMRAAKEEAETANRAKSTFLATMSHEIRTPMNAVLGLLELELRNPGERAATERALSTAHRAARDLLGLIDDILDVAKIEAERLVLAPAPLELNAWAAGVAAIYEPAARAKGIGLIVRAAPEAAGVWIEADALRLRQVLGNLLSNAIKFTDEGAVTLEYGAGAVDDGAREVLLAVSDTGVGIAPEQRAGLFSPFVQAHADSAGRYGGTGLGLTICRRLVTMMGGVIDVTSERGRGSRFTVRVSLPVASASALASVSLPASAPAESHGQAALSGLRVLVVDDHPANRMLLTAQLRLLGCAPDALEDGARALAAWRANPQGFDLILTDCSMPVMSGEDLARAVRADETARRVAHPLPILGVTANAQPEAAAEAVAAGMTACLVKPLALDDLRRALIGIVAAAANAAPVGVAPREPTPEPDSASPFDPALIASFGAQAAALVAALQSANEDDLATARNALDARDYRQLRETAHRMKGAAFVVGAAPFAAACLALQETCQRALDAPSGLDADAHRAIEHAHARFAEAANALDTALSAYETSARLAQNLSRSPSAE